ncbi:MAG TPA: PRC-barrel domain-containing protein [Anaerolineales bacterium]|nr:PRC-barrel domain-containing protein [Anaerolineales bacterium]
MFTGKDHRNKSIVSLTDGKLLGEVKDFYLDAQLTRLAAAFTGKEGLLSRKTFAVARGSIKVLGIDVWLASGPDAVVNLETSEGHEDLIKFDDVRGREITTEGGSKIATVDDVIFDGEGKVLGFALSKVLVPGPLSERKAIHRLAITSCGGDKIPMVAVMTQAEALVVTDAPAA